MKKIVRTLPGCCLAMLLLLVLGACSGSPGSSTLSTASPAGGKSGPTPTPSPTHKVGDNYTYVRNNQVWVSLAGAPARQITNFDYSQLNTPPAVSFDQPLWFDHGRFLVIKMRASNQSGVGGGCGGYISASQLSALLVYDTTSGKMQPLTLPGDHQPAPSAYDGLWSYIFKQDDTHLLAWHMNSNNNQVGGLYSIDMTQLPGQGAQAPQQVVPGYRVTNPDDPNLPGTPVATPASQNATSNPDILANRLQVQPMRYANNMLYFQTVQNIGDQKANLALYGIALNDPLALAHKVTDVGTVQLCLPTGGSAAASGTFVEPGWDVSPDGQYLAIQKVTADNESSHSSQLFLMKLQGTKVSPLTSSPSWATPLLSQAVQLSWSPNNRDIVLETMQVASNGQYWLLSASRSNLASIKTYTISNPGNITWRANGSQFALYSTQPHTDAMTSNVVSYQPGKATGQLLLPVAVSFAWSN